jgi:hypothetical protein
MPGLCVVLAIAFWLHSGPMFGLMFIAAGLFFIVVLGGARPADEKSRQSKS